MMRSLVNYVFARDPLRVSGEAGRRTLPPIQPGVLYEYVFAANGVFARGQRDGLEAIVPVARFANANTLRGLAMVEPSARLRYPRVPAGMLAAIVDRARGARDAQGNPVEILFDLSFDANAARWRLIAPPQEQGRARVISADRHSLDAARALIQAHSHHAFAPVFSRDDDRDHTGFQLYAVLGHLSSRPTLRVRVGVYGYRMDIPAWTIFEEIPEVTDAQADDA